MSFRLVPYSVISVADLRGGGEPAPPAPFGRRTDAVTVLLISENDSVLWRPIVS